MKDYKVSIVSISKPLVINAASEDEAKAVANNMLLKPQGGGVEFFPSEIRVRKANQHWLKEFIYNNF